MSVETGPIQLLGAGRAIPDERLAGELLGAPIDVLASTGFARVRTGGDPSRTIDLWEAAARAALADAGMPAGALGGVIAVRSGHVPALSGAWLSLVLAGRLGIDDPRCLDLHGAGCAGALHALTLAGDLSSRGARPLLLVGGGSSGYTRRWFADPPGHEPRGGILVGDGAYAVVCGRGGRGAFEVTAVEAILDRAEATSWRRPAQDYEIDDADLLRFLSGSRAWSTRVVMSVMMKATAAQSAPLFFIGTNAGRDLKRQLCHLAARGAADPRLAASLEVQLADLAEHGHLFGGDTISNLCAIRAAGLLRPGDAILALEVGGTYLYSAAILRATGDQRERHET